MCTVTINIDEATMRQINPNLTSRESIGKWLQHRVDLMIEEIVAKVESETLPLEESLKLYEEGKITDEELSQIPFGRNTVHIDKKDPK